MLGFKKKLSALLPSDARSHLQNVLTVEWENGNKTVLVDLPDTGRRPSEVEMSGMSSGSGGEKGYGRLADDDEGDDPYTRPVQRSRKSSQKSSSSYPQKSLPALPSRRPSRIDTYTSSSSGPSPNVNPFESEYHSSPQTSSSSTFASSPYSTASDQLSPSVYSSDSRSTGVYGSGQPGRRKAENPWMMFKADDVDMLGHSGLDSPTASEGMRDSAGSARSTNPFQ